MQNSTITVQTDHGQTELYLSKIHELFDAYKSRLPDPDEDIRKVTYFTGGLKYVYQELFQPHTPQRNNRHTLLDTADIDTLNRIWDIYTDLCYSNGIRPTLLRFSLLTGISPDTFDSWRRQEYRGNTPEHSDSVKRWIKECESAAVDGALQSNSIGSIFILKSCYNYRETSPVSEPEMLTGRPLETPEQIMERYRDVEKPELPADLLED